MPGSLYPNTHATGSVLRGRMPVDGGDELFADFEESQKDTPNCTRAHKWLRTGLREIKRFRPDNKAAATIGTTPKSRKTVSAPMRTHSSV